MKSPSGPPGLRIPMPPRTINDTQTNPIQVRSLPKRPASFTFRSSSIRTFNHGVAEKRQQTF
jgi:hypothetical protein